jgi:hypothetical protein
LGRLRCPARVVDFVDMATRTHTVHLTPDAYDRLLHEADRRGVAPDELADELLTADLAPVQFDLEPTLTDLADIRSRVHGTLDAVSLVREGRDELEQRSL